VWRQSENDEHAILGRRFVLGEGWTTPVVVSPARPEGGLSLRLAVNPVGQALAVWDRGAELWSSRFTHEAGWDQEERISVFERALEAFEVGMNPQGVGASVWAHGTTGTTVTGARFVPGTGWGDPSTITITESFLRGLTVAVDSQGQAFAAWVQMYGEGHGVWTSLLLSSGDGWLDPLLLVAVAAGASLAILGAYLFYRSRQRKG
jgi:hypothetical protein